MKKLMFVAAAALSASVFADTGITSDVVGYAAGVDSVDGFNFMAIPFQSVGYNTSDIQQLKISDGDAGTIGWGGETFEIWNGAPSTVEGSGFFYYDSSMDPTATATDFYWGDSVGNKAAFSFQPGQGIAIGVTSDGLTTQTAGGVSDDDATLTSVSGFNFIGNPFPTEIDIQNIKISDGDAGTIGWGGETFEIWKGAPSTVAGSGFFYYDSSMDPTATETDFYWGDSVGNKVSYSIPCGQAAAVGVTADGLEFTIKAPYTLNK